MDTLTASEYPAGGVFTHNADPLGWVRQATGRKRQRPQRTTNLNLAIDRSVRQGGLWQKGTFTVPLTVSEERVKLLAHKYINKFGNGLEELGWTVHSVTEPVADRRPLPVPFDRKRYIMFAWVSRRPEIPVFDIPDIAVPRMQALGLRLLE